MNPNPLTGCKALISKALQTGSIPAMFVMNAATHKHLTELALEDAPDKKSFKHRWLRWRKKHISMVSLYGVPVLDNSHFPDGIVSLQLMPTLETVQRHLAAIRKGQMDGEAVQAPGGGMAATQDASAAAQAAPANPDVPRLEDLTPDIENGKPSCTDILIRGMEQVENLRAVAVVRVWNNGNIDLATNLGKFELQGVLQHAQMWSLQNGE